MKRGYFVHNNDDDAGGIAVVATSAKEARKIGYKSGELIYGDTDYISIQANWQRDANVDDLPIGVVHDMRMALLCGIYGWLEEYPCDVCGKDGDVQEHDGRVVCDDCLEAAVQNGG